MPHAPCPMPNAQCPFSNGLFLEPKNTAKVYMIYSPHDRSLR
jgi:hypothetical protein